jgi:hypothetical protein
MVKKLKFIKNGKSSILSSERLDESLKVIKLKAHLPSAHFALELIAVPLAEALATKGDNASFSVYPNGNSILIQIYGNDIASSGKLTDVLQNTIGA